jgi:hypothetical protein
MAILKDVTIGDCRVQSCTAPAYCKGFCEPHYRRLLTHGNPTAGKTFKGEPVAFLLSIPQTDDCVNWPYRVGGNGYGHVRLNGKMMNAHRASLIIHSGADGNHLHAAHAPNKCHNRLCVNPRHLRWATPQANMQDRHLDGTTHRPVGSLHGAAVLTEKAVIAIRKSQESQKALAEVYGVSKQTISKIIRRERWAHV